ncbi:glycosyltransferase [Paenarthrobacter aromaticivorans]|uniref:Glycosyltransferase n=1 Tax=Paenarthrobacter aromaticivorans TaxID=2849150 RepID=A0ABS6IAY9_9MICC|nr:glycosyltransferase [Paenarthrobacter sp. MMS21-TAE1-1]MBU8867592.1 glycosyltransferase [Paenarthrobacter sp. MMS21-TAE1-1]
METIVYLSGTRWDSLSGTDKMLATSLAKTHHILWVDHPVPLTSYEDVRRHLVRSLRGVGEDVATNISRLRIPALPGVSKPMVRRSTDVLVRRCVGAALDRSARRIAGIVNSSPIMLFPSRRPEGTRLLHVTDDWLAGTNLMGFTSSHLIRVLEENIRSADAISAVSEELAAKISRFSGRPVEVLPNGCTPATTPSGSSRSPVVALVGQLNNRLDLDALESVAATEVPLLIIGPRADGDPVVRSRLDALLSRPNVDWRGLVAQEDVALLLQSVSVGITPYADTEFNRSSFPLKTLEYLAAGLRVVATDLPSTRWIDSPAIAAARTPTEFSQLVLKALREPMTRELRKDMDATARQHSWDSRGAKIRGLLSAPTVEGLADDVRPTVDHALLTRFNLPSKGFESLVRAKDGWLHNRVELFERYCLPSVRAQTRKGFHWIVYFDPESPKWLLDRIQDLSADGLFTPIFRAEVSADELLSDIEEVTGRQTQNLLTTNVDNDDGLAADFVAQVQDVQCSELPSAIYLSSGLIKGDASVYLRHDDRNAFCSVRSSWSAPVTCWSAWHNQLSEIMATEEIGGPPAWLQVVHGLNVSNRIRGRLVAADPFADRFPGLLDDVATVRMLELVRDALFEGPVRLLRDGLRSAIKAATIRLLGRSGIDRVKVFLGQSRREIE